MTSGTDWVIRGARPLGGEPADITITDGTITAIGDAAGEQGAQALDAAGLIALPGLVDLHTHLREPGREDAETIETGTLAAALGGFTAVHAMANTDPSPTERSPGSGPAPRRRPAPRCSTRPG